MYCACGCGHLTNIAKQNHADRGIKKGDHYTVIRGHGVSVGRDKRFIVHGKYVMTKASAHPKANARGYVYEHILVAEKALGTHLPNIACVHHVNEDGTDNTPNNLVICQDGGYHKLLHVRQEALRNTGDANQRRCNWCGIWLRQEEQVIKCQKRGRERIWHHGCKAWHVGYQSTSHQHA